MSEWKVAEWIEQVVYEQAVIREAHLRAIIRPKPRWLPTRVWHWLLRRILYIEDRLQKAIIGEAEPVRRYGVKMEDTE